MPSDPAPVPDGLETDPEAIRSFSSFSQKPPLTPRGSPVYNPLIDDGGGAGAAGTNLSGSYLTAGKLGFWFVCLGATSGG